LANISTVYSTIQQSVLCSVINAKLATNLRSNNHPFVDPFSSTELQSDLLSIIATLHFPHDNPHWSAKRSAIPLSDHTADNRTDRPAQQSAIVSPNGATVDDPILSSFIRPILSAKCETIFTTNF
jgi:hypothetical protein